MAVIRCPNCGKENPDFLDVCQFCQAPLSPGLRIGDKPTKKNTGELEPVLPDWLRDIRQQARDLAEEDAAKRPPSRSPKRSSRSIFWRAWRLNPQRKRRSSSLTGWRAWLPKRRTSPPHLLGQNPLPIFSPSLSSLPPAPRVS